MPVSARLNYLRISPRKVRLVADMIRGKKVGEARDILRFAVKKPSLSLLKLLDSAEANAKNDFQISPENLYIAKITIDEGPKYKRWRPRARGRAYPIHKKTSHITIILEPIKGKAKKIKKKKQSLAKKETLGKEVKKQQKTLKKEKPQDYLKEELKVKREKPIQKIFRRKSF